MLDYGEVGKVLDHCTANAVSVVAPRRLGNPGPDQPLDDLSRWILRVETTTAGMVRFGGLGPDAIMGQVKRLVGGKSYG
jgi:hypothetical protein